MVERLMKLHEVAEAWGCSLSSVRRVAKAGGVRTVVVGKRSIRVPASEADRYVRDGMAPARPVDSRPVAITRKV